jgi:hypothetical protein
MASPRHTRNPNIGPVMELWRRINGVVVITPFDAELAVESGKDGESYIRSKIEYGGRSPKFTLAPRAQLYSLA